MPTRQFSTTDSYGMHPFLNGWCSKLPSARRILSQLLARFCPLSFTLPQIWRSSSNHAHQGSRGCHCISSTKFLRWTWSKVFFCSLFRGDRFLLVKNAAQLGSLILEAWCHLNDMTTCPIWKWFDCIEPSLDDNIQRYFAQYSAYIRSLISRISTSNGRHK